jgi:hypothetical protein
MIQTALLPPPCTAVTALEELPFAHGSFSEGIVRYLNVLRLSHRSVSAATAGTTPVMTGLLGLISGAAYGRNLPNTVQAIDLNVRDDEKKPARMVRETPAKAKDKPGLRCPGQLPSVISRHPSEVR